MPEYKTEPIIVPVDSGLLPERERNRRVALTSFDKVLAPRVAVPEREVVCYECGCLTRVPTAALSAKCSHCQGHLKMTDVMIKPGSQRLTVRTLGDVTVHADAVLSQLNITAHNCHVLGRGSGTYRCFGTMQVCCSNRMEGSVQANRLVVERAVDLVLVQGAGVETLVVGGRVTGRIVARKEIVLKRGAELYGNCFTPSLVIEPGAVHRGEWHREIPTT